MHIDVCKLFCDLIETQSFSATADLHGVTQSAVSQKIRSLENHFNVPLLERGRNRVRLTPEGALFLEASGKMLSTYEELHEGIDALQSKVEGLLKIATVLSVGMHELPIYVNRFREQFPNVELRIEYRRASQVYSEVIDGRIDLGLVAYPRRRKGVIVHSFWKDRLVVICSNSHPLAKRLSVTVEDLADSEMVGFEPDLPSQKAIEDMFQQAGVEIHQRLCFDNVDTVKKAVEMGQGVAIVPMRAAHVEVETGRLTALMLNDPNCWRPLGILGKRSRAVTPVMREFISVLTHGRQVSGAFPQPLKAPNSPG